MTFEFRKPTDEELEEKKRVLGERIFPAAEFMRILEKEGARINATLAIVPQRQLPPLLLLVEMKGEFIPVPIIGMPPDAGEQHRILHGVGESMAEALGEKRVVAVFLSMETWAKSMSQAEAHRHRAQGGSIAEKYPDRIDAVSIMGESLDFRQGAANFRAVRNAEGLLTGVTPLATFAPRYSENPEKTGGMVHTFWLGYLGAMKRKMGL